MAYLHFPFSNSLVIHKKKKEKYYINSSFDEISFICKTNFYKYLCEQTKAYCPYICSRLRRVLMNGVLKNFAKFTAKNLCRSLSLNKVAGFQFLREHFLQDNFGGCF